MLFEILSQKYIWYKKSKFFNLGKFCGLNLLLLFKVESN